MDCNCSLNVFLKNNVRVTLFEWHDFMNNLFLDARYHQYWAPCISGRFKEWE